jgi:hypothetical protein
LPTQGVNAADADADGDGAPPGLLHIGTAFFDGVHSARVRARLSDLFAGGVPLVGMPLACPGYRQFGYLDYNPIVNKKDHFII